jgi:hypothetical protein
MARKAKVVKKIAKKPQSISITFSYNPIMKYCWDLNGKAKVGVVNGGGGHLSLTEIFYDEDFLKTFVNQFGEGSISPKMMGIAWVIADGQKKNSLPITDDMIQRIEEAWDIKVTDNQGKKLKVK